MKAELRQSLANTLSWRDKAESLRTKSCLEFTSLKCCRGESCTERGHKDLSQSLYFFSRVLMSEWEWGNYPRPGKEPPEQVKVTVHGSLSSLQPDSKTSWFVGHQVELTEVSSSIIGNNWSKTLLQSCLINLKSKNKQYPSKLTVTQNKAQEYLWQYKNIQHLAKWSSQCWNSIKNY